MSFRFSIRMLTILAPLWIFGGRYGDAFIKTSLPPVYGALGGATLAYQSRVSTGLINPAGAGWEANRETTLGYNYQGGLLSNYTLEQRFSLGSRIQTSMLWAHVGVDGILLRPDLISDLPPDIRQDSIRNSSGSGWGEFKDREDLVLVTLASRREFLINLGWRYFKLHVDFPFGINFKYFHKSLWTATANGYGMDLGAQFGIRVVDSEHEISANYYIFGIKLNDFLNTPVYWTTQHQDVIKRDLQWGILARHQFDNAHWRIDFLYSNYLENGNRHHWGSELDFAQRFLIQAGYFNHHLGFGLGLIIGNWKIDYGFTPTDLYQGHGIAITYSY